MGYATGAKNAMLDALATLADYASLHSADPGITGANEVTGGSPAYARKTVTWGAAADGVCSLSSQPIFDVPAGNVLYVGYWTAVSGGSFLGGAILSPAPDEFTEQGLFKILSGEMDLNAVGSVTPEMIATALLGAHTADGVGLLVPLAAGAATDPSFTASGEVLMVPLASVAGTVTAITASGTVYIPAPVTADCAATLAAFTSSAEGMMVPLAEGAADVTAMTSSATGVRVDTGTGAADITALTSSATGEYGTEEGFPGTDDFTGTDGAAPNTAYWDAPIVADGSHADTGMTIQSNALRLRARKGTGTYGAVYLVSTDSFAVQSGRKFRAKHSGHVHSVAWTEISSPVYIYNAASPNNFVCIQQYYYGTTRRMFLKWGGWCEDDGEGWSGWVYSNTDIQSPEDSSQHTYEIEIIDASTVTVRRDGTAVLTNHSLGVLGGYTNLGSSVHAHIFAQSTNASAAQDTVVDDFEVI